MFCKNCGTKMEDNAKFCVNCGWKVGSEVQKYNEKKSVKIPIIPIIMVIVLIVGVFLVKEIFFSSKPANKFYYYFDDNDETIMHLTLNEKPGKTKIVYTINKLIIDTSDIILDDENKTRITLNHEASIIYIQHNEDIDKLINTSEIILDEKCEFKNADLLFSGFINLKKINAENIIFKFTKSAFAMFYECSSLTDIDVSKWDTSNVTGIGMSAMFEGCSTLTNLDVSKWNTSKVTDMSCMFYGCSSLTNLDVSNWDTKKVTRMHGMFSDCDHLISLDVSNWDTSKVTDMSYMFDGCSSLTNLDVSNWDTSNVTNMSDMFDGCPANKPSWYHK